MLNAASVRAKGVGRCIAGGLQQSGSRGVIPVAMRHQDMTDSLRRETADKGVDMIWIVWTWINNCHFALADDIGSSAVIGECPRISCS